MQSYDSVQSSTFLSTTPAQKRNVRSAQWVVAVAAVVFALLVGWAKTPLFKIPAFIPIYESVIVINDAITAVMLFGLFRILRSRSILWLANGYLMTSLMAIVHMLSFPDLFSPTGLLGAGPQTTAWLYMFWHGGFPVFVMFYVLTANQAPVRGRWSSYLLSFFILVLVAAFTALATVGQNLLPAVMNQNHYTPALIVVISSVIVLGISAILVLWKKRQRSVLDLWLMVALVTWVFEVTLSAALNAGRFDLGFYFGRIYGMLATSCVLWVLLLEHSALYSQLQRVNSELTESNRQLLEASRLKSQFLANMSHEIRTPLNAIIGLSSLAIRAELPPKQLDFLIKIRDAGDTLLGIINDILDLSKIEAGRLELEEIEFSLEKVLLGIETMFEPKARGKGLDYSQRIESEIPQYLVGDPLRLSQILINLVGNAVKFTSTGGISVRVKSKKQEGSRVTLEFSIRDSGIGIARDKIDRLFSAFSQADSSTTRRFGGTGLGLAISKLLANRMGGDVFVESQEGEGSCFTFWVEFAINEKKETTRQVIPPILQGIRVLVIEENGATKQRLRTFLSSYPFQVDYLESGSQALDHLKKSDQAYGLLLVDLWLSSSSGFEILKFVKSNSGRAKPPAVILLSSLGSGEERDRAYREGADGFLVEPISSSSLSDAILRIFSPRARTLKEANTIVLWEREAQQELNGARVLVVEDNEVNMLVVTELLQSVGVQTDSVSDGRQAIEKIQRTFETSAYDIVLMDIQMPEMDGYAATRELRSDPRLSDLPIIAVSAHALTEEHRKAKAAGMTDHVTKPIDPQKLFETLRKHYKPEKTRSQTELLQVSSDPSDILLEIPGIDVLEGLARVAGNRKLYFDLLRKFADQRSYSIVEIRIALKRSDRKTAEREIHTLRGVAGNIGAKEIAHIAEALEHAIRDGIDADVLTERLDRLEILLDSVFRRIRLAVPEPREPVNFESENQTEVLLQLRKLLLESDAEAVSYGKKNTALFSGLAPKEEILRLENALEVYSFSEALDVLDRMIRRQGSEVREENDGNTRE